MTAVPETLAAIAARAEAATPGPWEVADDFLMADAGTVISNQDEQGGPSWNDDDDAEFIAHAREDIPFLLALVTELQGQLADAREKTWDECLDAIDQNELNTDQAREGNPHRNTALANAQEQK